MDPLTQFDDEEKKGVSLAVVETNTLSPDLSVVVIPLLAVYAVVRQPGPEICHDGPRVILATRLSAAVRRSSLQHTGNVLNQGSLGTRAIDNIWTFHRLVPSTFNKAHIATPTQFGLEPSRTVFIRGTAGAMWRCRRAPPHRGQCRLSGNRQRAAVVAGGDGAGHPGS
jgi:toxin CcdB